MSFEDILRKIIREELKAVLSTPVAVPKVKATEPEPDIEDFLVDEPSVEVHSASELLAYLKDNCTTEQAAKAKKVTIDMGYERISVVPDTRAQAVLDKILEVVFN